MMGSSTVNMYACIGVTVTPSRAWRTPARPARENGIEPNRWAASQSPAGTPGTPHDAGPMLKTCGVSSNRTSTATSSPRAAGIEPACPRPRRRSRAGGPRPRRCGRAGSRRRRGAVSGLSAANEVSTAQIAASNALPPSRSTSAPASAVSRWPAATTPVLRSDVASVAAPPRRRRDASRLARV